MLKNNKFVRRLALLLCLALLVGIVPVSIWSVPSVVNAVPEGTVVFSDDAEAYNFKKLWTLTGSVMAWSDANYRYQGDRVMLLQTPNDTATSPSFAVTPGKEYTLNYYTKQHTAPAVAGKGSAQIRFFDASGKLLSGATVKAVACGVTDWEAKSLTAIAPQGAVSGRIYFDTEGDSKLIYVVDVMTVTERDGDPDATVPTQATEATEATEATQPSGNLLVNAGFEDDMSNWESYITSEVVTGDAHSGNTAVKIIDETRSGGGYIKQSFSVEPGKTYELSAWVKVLSGSAGYFGIYSIGNAAVAGNIGSNSGWTKVSVSVTIPDGFTTASIEIGSGRSAITTYLVDDVVFAEVGAEPEETEPTVDTTPTTPSTPTEGEGSVIFEDDIEAYNFKQKWMLTGTTMRWPPNPGFGYQGDFVMILQGNGDTAMSPAFAVTHGKGYTLRYMTKQFVAGAAGNVEIRFFNASGAMVGTSSKLAACGAADWTEKVLTATAPANAATARIYFDAPGENYVVDVITVTEFGEGDPNATQPTQPVETKPVETKPTEPTEATEPPVYSDAFEQYYTPDGANRLVRIPKNWEASEQTAAIGCAKYDAGYDGSWNLCIQDIPDKWMRSPLTEAVPGYEYHVTFQEKKYQPGKPGAGGYVKIVFVDADGNALKVYEIEAGTSKNWTEKVLYAKAPKGAKSFYVEFGMKGATGEPTYSVDDLAVYAFEASLSDPDVTQPTEPIITVDPMKPIDEKFELQSDVNDANSGPAGWFSNDDSNGVFAPMIALVNDELSYDGNYLILRKAGKWSVQSSDFPVEVGYAYTASFMARKLFDNENFYGFVEINFINTRGKIVETKTVPVGKTYGAWTQESVTAVAPVGAIKAHIRFALEYNDRRADGDYAIDDLTVTRSEEQVFEYTPDPNSTEPSEYVPIYEDTFASYYKPDPNKSVNLPKGWTGSEQSAALGTATYDSYDGTRNLCLQDRGDKWIKSPMVNAKAGNIYYATFVEKKLQSNQEGSGGYIKVCFVDENDKIIKEYRQNIGTSKTWTELEVGGQAPEGTARLYVEFGIENGIGAPSYSVDNLVVIEGVPSKPGSQPSNPGTTPDVDQPGGTTPSVPENNPNTNDNLALVMLPALLSAMVVMAVLVIKKRKFF